MSDYPPSPPPPGGYGYGYPQPQSNAPTVLGVIGIVCWFFCTPASVVLGLVGQSQARRLGQSDTLPKVAWIGGVVLMVLGLVIGIVLMATGVTNVSTR